MTEPTYKIYAQQRFDPEIFTLLALYLIFYARPYLLPSEDGSGGILTGLFLILLLVLVFCFRLFDDLWSREIDAKKPNRIYTDSNSHAILKNFLIGFFTLVILVIWVLKKEAAVALLIFSAYNFTTYFVLFKRWKWHFILPLLKYPFLCFLLTMFFKNDEISTGDILICVSLFPAFLLFEIFDDKEFSFRNPVIITIFILGNLLLLCVNPASVGAWFISVIGIISFILILKKDVISEQLFPYTFLIYFLILRFVVQL